MSFITLRVECTVSVVVVLTLSQIASFKDVKDIGSLPAQPLLGNTTLKETLIARGRKFLAFQGSHHLEYEGTLMQPPQQVVPVPGQMFAPPPLSHFQVHSLYVHPF